METALRFGKPPAFLHATSFLRIAAPGLANKTNLGN